MFAIVYKEDKVPMCARLKESGPDAVVTWDTGDQAKAFLERQGAEMLTAYDVVAISDESLSEMAKSLGDRKSVV